MGRIFARLAADRRGASAVELGLAAPIFCFALLAAYDLSRGFSARLELVEAAARSAELATSLGQVRADYAFLASEAQAAATASGRDGATAAVDAWLECNGVRQANANSVCPTGQAYARYVEVEITDTYTPVFNYGGLIGQGGALPIRGAATVRIQ
jgi:Flp pilus assembly protein TadG